MANRLFCLFAFLFPLCAYGASRTFAPHRSVGAAQEFIATLSEKFGAFRKYHNKNVEIDFEFFKSGALESGHKQYARTGSVYDQAKLITIMPDVIKGAVPIETHPDLKQNVLKRVYVLVSAFVEGNDVVPVQFEVKEYADANVGARLYMAVTLGNKKTGVKAANPYLDGQVLTARPVLIRITDLAKNNNPENKRFLIYLPDQMLNENQIRAKWEAIDERYFSALNNTKNKKTENDLEEAAKRVKLAARNSGYTIEAYHGSRHIFNAFSYEKRGTNTRTKASEGWFFAGDRETANSYYPYGVMKELAK